MDQVNEKPSGGVFLNGKAQIIEMLQYMTTPEREKLLKNIKHRNPSLASELMEKSFSFKYVENLESNDLYKLAKQIQPQIFGVALKNQGQSFQRKLLTSVDRQYAEIVYQVMTKPLNNEIELTERAQKKIISSLMMLAKKGFINLSK